MRETESPCAENIGLKDIARSRREELISRGELIMYYSSSTLDPQPSATISSALGPRNIARLNTILLFNFEVVITLKF